MLEKKQCKICKAVKTIDNFYKDKAFKDGHDTHCSTCYEIKRKTRISKNPKKVLVDAKKWRDAHPEKIRAYHRKRIYGIDDKKFEQMLVEHDYKCAICKKPHTPEKKYGPLAVDHCHKTNLVRGLLCQECNKGIGHLQDDLNLVKAAVLYLSLYS